ncbi:MAG TPA: ABC transporter substrate-binding protein, partial [Idiomarina sp.]|nr:ABC transporter substrate-binding protein [Idiomarina sp.]
EPPDQLTYRDATNLKEAGQAKLQAAMTQSAAVIEPKELGKKPFMAYLRLTHNDFFELFEPPFLYGQGWSDEADKSGRLTIVLSKKNNDELFDGANSVGETITMMDR